MAKDPCSGPGFGELPRGGTAPCLGRHNRKPVGRDLLHVTLSHPPQRELAAEILRPEGASKSRAMSSSRMR